MLAGDMIELPRGKMKVYRETLRKIESYCQSMGLECGDDFVPQVSCVVSSQEASFLDYASPISTVRLT